MAHGRTALSSSQASGSTKPRPLRHLREHHAISKGHCDPLDDHHVAFLVPSPSTERHGRPSSIKRRHPVPEPPPSALPPPWRPPLRATTKKRGMRGKKGRKGEEAAIGVASYRRGATGAWSVDRTTTSTLRFSLHGNDSTLLQITTAPPSYDHKPKVSRPARHPFSAHHPFL
jgi:hypothetical protein